jgi:hypothetical protein
MNTMNMPGFTAGISLYKTSGRYRASVFAAQQRTVAPQLDEVTFFEPFGLSDTTDPTSISAQPTSISAQQSCRSECARAKQIWLERCGRVFRIVDVARCVARAEAFEDACNDSCDRL